GQARRAGGCSRRAEIGSRPWRPPGRDRFVSCQRFELPSDPVIRSWKSKSAIAGLERAPRPCHRASVEGSPRFQDEPRDPTRGPLGLDSISKETFSPPCSLSKLPSVGLRWKKYSFPSSAAMKPKPRSETSFLMVPAGISISYALEQGSTQPDGPVPETGDRRERRAGVPSAG